MISFNSQSFSQRSDTGIFINQYTAVQAAAEVTGYNIQYPGRILCFGALKGGKIKQMWLVELDTLEAINMK